MISHLYTGKNTNAGSIQAATSPVGESPRSSSWKGDGGRPLNQEPSIPPEASQHPRRNRQGLRSFPCNRVGHVSSKILPTPIQSATLERQRSHVITLPCTVGKKPNGGIFPTSLHLFLILKNNDGTSTQIYHNKQKQELWISNTRLWNTQLPTLVK